MPLLFLSLLHSAREDADMTGASGNGSKASKWIDLRSDTVTRPTPGMKVTRAVVFAGFANAGVVTSCTFALPSFGYGGV